MKLHLFYLCTSSEGEEVAAENIQIEFENELILESNIENQDLFNVLNKFGWENELLIGEKLREILVEIPNPEEFHSHYYIMGIDDWIVDYSGDFFDFGDNSSMYFNL
jgi:hypothetical protein